MKCKFCDGSGKDYWELNGVPYPCPVCNGTGEVQVTGDSVTDICDKCGGTGKITKKDSVTNEKWLCSLPTDKKALIIAELSSYGGNVYALEKWLKEIHK